MQAAGSATLDELLPAVYDDVPERLRAMARRSLLAHVLKLQHDGQAVAQSAGDDSGPGNDAVPLVESLRWRWVGPA